MKDIAIAHGTMLYDFYFIPTIAITKTEGSYRCIYILWMDWYIGFAWDRKEK